MSKTAKKIFMAIFIPLVVAILSPSALQAQEKSTVQSQSAYTSYHDCIRLYKLPFGKLYFLALSAATALGYEIRELQSRNGYIIIEADGHEFLLSVNAKNKSYTYLKLSPCDNNYYFNPQIPKKIFNYVDLNFNMDIKDLKF